MNKGNVVTINFNAIQKNRKVLQVTAQTSARKADVINFPLGDRGCDCCCRGEM